MPPSDESINTDSIHKNVTTWLRVQQKNSLKEKDNEFARNIEKLILKWNQTELPEGFCHEEKKAEDLNCSDRTLLPLKKNVRMVFIWMLMIALLALSTYYKFDQRITTGSFILIGVLSHAFSWLVGIVTLVPIIGPLIVKILSIPAIWLLNSIGYLLSMVAIRRGYSKDVLTYRGLTVSLIIGIVIGYVLGEFI